MTTLVAAVSLSVVDGGDVFETSLFEQIAEDLINQGYSIRPNALPESLAQSLLDCQYSLNDAEYSDAGIGRNTQFAKNGFVRTDEICWIDGSSQAGADWLAWSARLQSYLNRRLFLGLFSFESHFAHYGPGDFYKRHYDAFKGETNRVLSLVTYLNPNWGLDDGGELVIYHSDFDREGTKVVPMFGTVVVFLSEEFPHEVLPAQRSRNSIAGWFRVNTSINNKIDPAK